MLNAWIKYGWDLIGNHLPWLAYDINYRRRYKRYEPDIWQIPQFCNAHTRVIDVGANMGIYSRWMAKHAQYVESFECNPSLINSLKQVLPLNVKIHDYALSSSSGKTVLRFDPNNTGIGTVEVNNLLDQNEGIKKIQEVAVKLARLDDFAFDAVSFIKIDVEGHELEVLKGAENTLKKFHPALLIEIEERHCPGNLVRVPDWLKTLDYLPCILTENTITPIQELNSYAQQGRNNFWFINKFSTK
ncbi:MAG: FkbM family methyltransferase [Spirosomataceae bacterium]